MRSAEVLALAASRAPTLGAGRLISVDGPAGSGKTTLAAELAAGSGAALIHLDQLYDGWGGLPGIGSTLDRLLRPLALGRPGTWRRYDWHAGAFAETVTVEPTELLVLEGVGSGSAAIADLVTVLVWLDAPPGVRKRRALDRDGETFAPHWDRWTAGETTHFAAEQTRQRADVRIVTG